MGIGRSSRRYLHRREFGRHAFRRVARHGIELTVDAMGHRRYHPPYGLVDDEPGLLPPGRRPVADRWDLISEHLPSSGSAMDIGCQNGWFVFKMAERGLVSLGVEVFEPDYRLSQWLTLYNQSHLASFIRMDVNPESALSLPAVDVVLCMSVFHHWARLHGLAHAQKIMQALADRCRDRMFFETGQPDEVERRWHDNLSFMEPSPRHWSEQFLLSLGFSRVEFLGETRSGKRKDRKMRNLILAVR